MRVDVEFRQAEMELRLLCLLSSADNLSLTEEEMLSYDFEITYGDRNLVPYADLHGDFGFKRSEVLVRTKLIRISLRSLVVRGLVHLSLDGSYLEYTLTQKGKSEVNLLDNEYARAYRANGAALFEANSH